MKPKGRLQYVQQFRKITAIQKLPTLKQGFGDLFNQNKNGQNKFIRLKQQPYLNQLELNSRNQIFCQNQFIKSYIKDNQKNCRQDVQDQIDFLNKEINYFNKWAAELSQFIKQGNYVYKFRLSKSSPPVPLSKETLEFDPLQTQIMNSQINQLNKNKNNPNNNNNNKSQILPQTILNNRKKRYDFNQITKYLVNSKFNQEDNDGSIDLIKKDLQHYRKYKTIKDIQTIEQLNLDYDRYMYNLKQPYQNNQFKINFKKIQQYIPNPAQDHSIKNLQKYQLNNGQFTHFKKQKFQDIFHDQLKNFKYLSILKSNPNLEINFFRDIGPPSRNIEDFIKLVFVEDNLYSSLVNEEDNPLLREKIDTHLLHYLQPNQLKIDKANLNFNDIQNISMCRMTSTNAHICIRSQKVTRSQYQKLLRKMQKLYKMQNQDGKSRQHIGITTEQYGQEQNNIIINSKLQTNPKNLTVHKLIEQINSIRKQTFILKSPKQKQYLLINERGFNDQISKKLSSLLQKLYAKTIQDLPFNYSLLQIGFHIDQVNGLADQFYDKKKLIWFIMSVLQQIQRRKTYEKNLLYLQNKNKKAQQPKLTKYVGQKVVARDRLGTKNLHYNNRVTSTIKQKSVSPIKTSNNYFAAKTPVKDQNRSPLKSTTGNKNTTAGGGNTSRTPTKNYNQNSYNKTAKKQPSKVWHF